MDKIIDKIVGLGVAGLVLTIAMATTGAAGFAAVTAALAIIGGPFGGMIAGITVLGLISAISTIIAEYGIDKVVTEIVKGLIKKGKTKEEICNELDKNPWNLALSKDLKLKVKDMVNRAVITSEPKVEIK